MSDISTEAIGREAAERGMMSPAEAVSVVRQWRAGQGRYDLPKALEEALDVLTATAEVENAEGPPMPADARARWPATSRRRS